MSGVEEALEAHRQLAWFANITCTNIRWCAARCPGESGGCSARAVPAARALSRGPARALSESTHLRPPSRAARLTRSARATVRRENFPHKSRARARVGGRARARAARARSRGLEGLEMARFPLCAAHFASYCMLGAGIMLMLAYTSKVYCHVRPPFSSRRAGPASRSRARRSLAREPQRAS